MELSPFWEATNCAATQELPNILRNPYVHYRVRKSPPLVPILSQIDSVHIIPSYLSKIYFNIVHPSMSLVFLVVSFLLAFPPISYIHSSSPHSCYRPCPSHYNNTIISCSQVLEDIKESGNIWQEIKMENIFWREKRRGTPCIILHKLEMTLVDKAIEMGKGQREK
jgi:hypothetical protein